MGGSAFALRATARQPPRKESRLDGQDGLPHRNILRGQLFDALEEHQMFGKSSNQNSLALPPLAETNPAAVEVLRVWAAPGSPQQLTLRTTWKDPGAWGLLLADVARHAAQAYKAEGRDPEEVLMRIRKLWEAEWASPTNRSHTTGI
jgi:Domain of unknown function (DUF5076)